MIGERRGRHRPGGSSDELDAHVEAANRERQYAGQNHDSGDGEPDLPPTDEIEGRLAVVQAPKYAVVAKRGHFECALGEHLVDDGLGGLVEIIVADRRSAASGSLVERRPPATVVRRSSTSSKVTSVSSVVRCEPRLLQHFVVDKFVVSASRGRSPIRPSSTTPLRDGFGPGSRRTPGCESSCHAKVTSFGEHAIAPKKDHERAREDVGGDDVDERRDAEHEGKASHVADREDPKDQRADQ